MNVENNLNFGNFLVNFVELERETGGGEKLDILLSVLKKSQPSRNDSAESASACILKNTDTNTTIFQNVIKRRRS